MGHGQGYRFESRIPGADANPYLAFAAMLAAGLYGVEKKLPLPDPIEANAYDIEGLPEIPLTLRDAADALDQSEVAREVFGGCVIADPLHWPGKPADYEVTHAF